MSPTIESIVMASVAHSRRHRRSRARRTRSSRQRTRDPAWRWPVCFLSVARGPTPALLVTGSKLHQQSECDPVLGLPKIRRPKDTVDGDQRSECPLIASGRRHAAWAGEVRHARGTMIELAAERDELARHVIKRQLCVPG